MADRCIPKIAPMKKILVVCMGNICRSPMALVVLQSHVAKAGFSSQIKIDSAGTHAGLLGERPDPRAQAALLRRGYETSRARSRKIGADDFLKFDAVLAMDSGNIAALKEMCPPNQLGKLHLYLEFGSNVNVGGGPKEVPDPYYGNVAGFERVLDLCEIGAWQIVAKLTAPQANAG
jgi:protein-tyrosine phosphatase